MNNSPISLLWKGAAMGAANAIPGVSGGTIAFVTGIYETLINSIKSFDLTALNHLRKFEFKKAMDHVNFWFLVPLGIGVVGGIFSLAYLLKFLMKSYQTHVWAFFFGLILASVFSVGKMVRKWSPGAIVSLLAGVAIAAGIAFLPPATENDGFLYLVLCGVVAISSMIIPGVSGSYVLILLGNYYLIMIETLTKLGDAVKSMDFAKLGECLKIIVPVGIGCVVGIVALSHFLSWLFKRFHDAAVALMTGFVAGSLFVIWPWKNKVPLLDENGEAVVRKGKEVVAGYDRFLPSLSEGSTLAAIGLAVVAAAVVLLMEKFGSAREEGA